MTVIKKITSDDIAAVVALSETSGLFDADGIELIKGRLSDYMSGNDDLWFAAVDKDIEGAIYCIPEPMTDGTWNVLMLIVSPDSHGQGYGQALMNFIEETLAARNARLMIVETSSLDGFERARAFYPKCGYTEEARIKNFYTTGDDKVVFSKAIEAASKQTGV